MALDDYNPEDALDAYFPDRTEKRTARLWVREKLLADLADLGIVTYFKGGGSNPTTLTGYASTKLWLQVDAGITTAAGVVRAYDGSGDTALVASWPALDLAGLRKHLSVYSKTEVDALVQSGVAAPAGVLKYKGTWNAATNTTTPVTGSPGSLASNVGTEGDFWRVNTAGTTSINSVASWAAGDELYFGGGVWNKLGASEASTSITLPSASADTRITKIGTVNGGSSKYQVAATADGRVLVWGDTANFAFNAVGDRYAAYELPVPWASTASVEAIYCGLNYILVQTDESTGNLYHIGSSVHGQGGNGGTSAVTTLTKIAQFATDNVRIASVKTEANRGNTEAFWFAITTAGNVYSCGYSGAQHVMGYNSTTNLSTPRKMTESDGTTYLASVDAISCDTAYAPVWAHTTANKAIRWGAGTDGAHGNNSTSALTWPTYLETSVGSGVSRTDVAQIAVTGSSVSTARAVSWLLTTAGKIEASGSRFYGNGDGATLATSATNTFQTASGAIAALTVSSINAGGGETYACIAITSTGTGYICGYMGTALRGDGSTTDLNVFTLFSSLPSSFSGALTGAKVAGGATFTAAFLEATIGGAKSLASIGYDVYYNTAKATASTSAGSQTWGLVKGARGTLASWCVFGTHQEYGIAVLNSDGEIRTAGPSDQGQSGVQPGQTSAIDILQPVRTGLPRLVKPPTDRGAYSSLTSYSYNDIVALAGSTWIYTNGASSAGNSPPTLPTESNTYWRLFARGFPETSTIVFEFDGGGVPLVAGRVASVPITFTGTVQSWTLIADQTGAIVVDLWKDTYANYPPTIADTITASLPPTLSSASKNTSSTLTGWTTSLSPGDVLSASISSASTVTRATLALSVTRGA